MKLWLRKLAVSLVAIVTLGLYVPPLHIDPEANSNKNALASKAADDERHAASVAVAKEGDSSSPAGSIQTEQKYDKEKYIDSLTDIAKQQATSKLGPKIASQVEDEFSRDILPAMESVLKSVLEAADDDVMFYSITQQPAGGFGERIFHVYDERNEKDIARFHVRRDNRPMEGYWFNFHYHLSNDNFQAHHEIGEIYWDKNMPPKWMA
ncbi:YpjP family protein [Virgibacillus sp. 179-BFC.A HS]|uniref:YpjP family protein n=1 Tax=Tigheibacillus jepli TaxID=3035914 RepID=A0ABU5CDG3_9BACI|nr:YpjP family protein [Virgibacillus sp. 179-BFC.A HS]MDY0404376.1 YpjP family protein [Virgibacillus sp. 179-BFC.A HS]